MLNNRQTHCLARWLWLSGGFFFFWWPFQCSTWFKWWNDNNRMRWQMEKFTLFAMEWHSGKFETENYYYRCNCRGQKCFAFICLVFCVNMQKAGWKCLNVLLCHLNVLRLLGTPRLLFEKCKTFIKYRKQIDIFWIGTDVFNSTIKWCWFKDGKFDGGKEILWDDIKFFDNWCGSVKRWMFYCYNE